MSLPRSRSHNGPTNPRNEPNLKATQKRNSRSKGLTRSTKPRADRPHGPSGLSVGADRPQVHYGPSEIASRTSSTAP
jgi:hypothetical protein